MPHPIENIMHSSMSQLKNIVDVNTVVGSPVAAGGEAIVMPVSKVSLGFLSGGGEYGPSSQKEPVKRSSDMLDEENGAYPFAGAAAAGMSLVPMGFLYVNGNNVRLISTGHITPLERIFDIAPQLVQILEDCIKERSCDEQTE